MAFPAVAAILIGGATHLRPIINVLIGVFLFRGCSQPSLPVANQLFAGTDLSNTANGYTERHYHSCTGAGKGEIDNDKKNPLLKVNINLLTDNMVPIIFILFTLIGFLVKGVPFSFFLSICPAGSTGMLSGTFLVIPVIAGLGLNFGIVVGAMSGQIDCHLWVLLYRGYWRWRSALQLPPIATFFGYLTGKLFNKTRGQEMIASLIVGFFANVFTVPVPLCGWCDYKSTCRSSNDKN